MGTEDNTKALRMGVYWLLIVVSCASTAGRILTVTSDDGKTPFLSANDRSRWSTIRALVDNGTFELDEVIFRPSGKRDKHWHSIDLVRHRGWDGKEHYYSSKPTLLTVGLAGEYWLVQRALGITLEEHPLYVGRVMLLITNLIPLAIYFWLLTRLVERYGTSDWGRVFVMTCAAFGTFITTFSVTLNNHTLGAVTALATVYLVLSIWREKEAAGWRYALAGLCAGLTVANELPALALLAMVGVCLLWRSPLKTIVGFVPPVLIVAAAALGTNYWAHGSWKTPYAHRHDGPAIASISGDFAAELDNAKLPDAVRNAVSSPAEDIEVIVKTPGERWVLWDAEQELRYAVVATHSGTLEVRAWDNWYDYDGTYWTDEFKQGVDKGEPSRWVYAWHCLAGHHGIFSLTPIWLLSFVGVGLLIRQREQVELRGLAIAVVLLTLVVLAFYIVQRPLADRNYGGVSSGLRWMFWFTPLWLIALLPAADAMSHRRWLRGLAQVALAVSVLSAHYASLNPWSQPWLFDYWTYLGWIEY